MRERYSSRIAAARAGRVGSARLRISRQHAAALVLSALAVGIARLEGELARAGRAQDHLALRQAFAEAVAACWFEMQRPCIAALRRVGAVAQPAGAAGVEFQRGALLIDCTE